MPAPEKAMYNFDAVQGAGIFKTTDGGATWTQLPSTANSSFYYVNRLAICPTNSLSLLAATRSGIFRSVDGGTNWNLGRTARRLWTSCINPTNGQCVASGWNGNAFYSTDAGSHLVGRDRHASAHGFWPAGWNSPMPRAIPSIVYASVDNNSGEVYQSTDGGHTYSLVNTGNNYLGGQGWYDNCIWVDPTNPNILVVGGA